MISDPNHRIAESATRIYESRLQQKLEENCWGQFVAIEPESGDYFLGDTFSRAVAEASHAHPDRLSFVIRVGYDAAIHMGGISN